MATEVATTEVPKSKTLDKYAAAIKAAHGKSVELIFVIAENLKAAHDELASHDKTEGKFCAWVEANCSFTRMTAHNYLSVLEAFGGLPCKTVLQGFDPTALYYLAKDTTPEEVTEIAIERAKAGERITAKTAKAIAEEFTITAQEPAVRVPVDEPGDEPDDCEDEIADSAWDDRPADLAKKWSPAACVLAIRPVVATWAKLCPGKSTAELAQILRDLATQVEKGVWNEC